MQIEFSFVQSVYRGGYEWYDSDDYSRLIIGDYRKNWPKTPEAQRRLRCAGSMEDNTENAYIENDVFKTTPAMFLEFADLDSSEEQILSFTNKYGKLWDDFTGPCLLDYHVALDDLSDAVQLWTALKAEDTEALERFVVWDKAGRLRWKSELSKPIKTKGGEVVHFIDVKRPRQYKRGDLIGPGTALLDFVIETRPNWTFTMRPVRHEGTVSLLQDVDILLSALWVQFSLAVVDEKSFERCQFCGGPFEVAPQVNRADRLFCSDNCRVKAYQRRKKQAISLHQQGKPLRTIAKETSSDLDMVKKWIGEFESKENPGDEKTQGKR